MIFIFGAHNSLAQNKEINPGVIAKEKTHKLTQEFQLDGNQQSLVWRVFMAREKAKLEIENSAYSKEETEKIYLKVDERFQNSMKEYLTEEQYGKFKLVMKEYL
jgi:hypothetical protein